MRSQKVLYAFLLVALCLICWMARDHIMLTVQEPVDYVLNGDKDDIYERLLLVKGIKGQEIFDQTMRSLLDQHPPDMLAQQAVVRYIREHRRLEYLSDVRQLLANYETLDSDTTWITVAPNGLRRMNKTRNSPLISDLKWTLAEIE